MTPDQIKAGATYRNDKSATRRLVVRIDDGLVYYLIEGRKHPRPLRMTINQFSRWAEQISETRRG